MARIKIYILIFLSIAFFSGFSIVYSATLYDQAVAHWSFEEGSGLIIGDSRGTNHGTFIDNGSSPTGPTWRTQGKFGGAVNFNGTPDYISIPDSEFWNFTATNGSISFWLYQNTVTTAGLITQINNDNNWAVYTYSDGKICVGLGGVNEMVSASGTITAGKWFNIVVVKNGGTTTLYVDGNSVLSGTTGVWSNSGNPLRLGGHYHANVPYFLNGSLDEVAYWNRALTIGEITSLQTVAPNIPEPSSILLVSFALCCAFWRFF